ncbi:MAG: hypothetical protein PHV51_01450 [Methanosarcinaceae archaeon]|nr:hypothetical protein [Methanosarcinaceae archaeon]MDD4496809.1 hypothetical protein [Methanosarcinaceae archaeon]
MSESNNDPGVKIFAPGELIAGVVQKHRRFLEEYREEFEKLDRHLNQIEGDVKNSKDSKTQILERKEVLMEKRLQLYHQAEELLEKEVFQKMEAKTMGKIQEEIKKLKGQIQPEEEKEIADKFLDFLHKVAPDAGMDEETFMQIATKIREARNSHMEFVSIEESEKQLNEDYDSKNKELSQGRPQHKLLATKVKSHEEALKHWEKLKS